MTLKKWTISVLEAPVKAEMAETWSLSELAIRPISRPF